MAQTFTPTAPTLAAFDILYKYDQGIGDKMQSLTGTLRDGGPNGALLATVHVRTLLTQFGPMWLRFTLPAVQSVTVGQPYTFVASGPSLSLSSSVNVPEWSQCATDYSGGTGSSSRRSVYTDLHADFAFRAESATTNPSASVGDASVLEGDIGTRTLIFPVTLSQPSTGPVTVSYAVSGVTATGAAASGPGVDFNDQGGATGTVTITPPRTYAYIPVTVFSDTATEADETLDVTLSSTTAGYQIGRGAAIGTILNDDGVASGTTIGVGGAMVVRARTGKQRIQFAVTLSKPIPGGATVQWWAEPGSALWTLTAGAGGDYGGRTAGNVSFSSRATEGTISIPIWPGANPSSVSTTFTLNLGTVANVSELHATATGTIVPAPTGPNLPGMPTGLTAELGGSCTAIDPVNGPVPGSQIDVSWTAHGAGEALTGYAVTLTVTYPHEPTTTIVLSPVLAPQTDIGPQCFPIGTRVSPAVASYNDAGTDPPASIDPTVIAPTDLSWSSPAAISDGVPATFSSTTPCPTTRPDGSPIVGHVIIQMTLHTATRTLSLFPPYVPGGWSTTTSFNLGTQDLSATVVADCVELLLLPPSTIRSILIAQYTTNPIAVNP